MTRPLRHVYENGLTRGQMFIAWIDSLEPTKRAAILPVIKRMCSWDKHSMYGLRNNRRNLSKAEATMIQMVYPEFTAISDQEAAENPQKQLI